MQTFNQLFFKKKQIFSYFFKENSDTLEHDLHQIVETISFCRMLAHQLGKL